MTGHMLPWQSLPWRRITYDACVQGKHAHCYAPAKAYVMTDDAIRLFRLNYINFVLVYNSPGRECQQAVSPKQTNHGS